VFVTIATLGLEANFQRFGHVLMNLFFFSQAFHEKKSQTSIQGMDFYYGIFTHINI
jgi:hypothetical protein